MRKTLKNIFNIPSEVYYCTENA